MNEKLEKLNQEIAKTEAKLRRAEHKEKMLESHLPHPESVTDGQISTILKVLFHRGDTQRLVAQVLAENRKEDASESFSAAVGAEPTSTGRCAPCGQRMISVDFQSAPIITGEITLPLRWIRQLPFCGLSKIQLYFFYEIAYNEVCDRSENLIER